MVEIQCFFKNGESFYPCNEYAGEIVDLNYIEGAIELKANGVVLMDKTMWNYIDQLLAYLVDGVGCIKNNKPYGCCFPDQPIEVSFSPVDENWLSITVKCHSSVSETVRIDEYLYALKMSALEFFEKLGKIIPHQEKYKHVLSVLNEI
ncbi:hypothetical protein WH50_09905 [Pokkaliibacter plantistimulans]|uniref:Uncharacterized protein n=1 Tax=Pokkaliibacter plantistimulans TaxID=1635171 RepID=A0ABX5LXU4_9GAMM|nr:hypothetical protein [Pokkaliibacter plantistimulans]PXF31496.1 hypothetical protein WH50_09905 [Pokkaliibacter plantistimulans]